MDIIKQFLDAMAAAELSPANPSDIKADDKRHYYTVAGDKASSKKGSYCLRIDDGFGVGFFRNMRTGETHKFTSKSGKKLTPEQKAEFKRKAEEARKQQQAEEKARYAAAAKEAQNIWKRSEPVVEHEYLSRKGIQSHGLRVYRGALVVPMYKHGKISSLQFITASDKRFKKDAEIDGAFFPLAKSDDDKQTIIICEGYATGASLREALGYPVAVAFNCNNLKAVTIAMRSKYPDARIIIAADNDQWRAGGNIGIEKAQQAAVAIGGARVLFPPFPADDEQRRTDWNDWALAEGTDSIKSLFTAPAPLPEPIDDGIPDWHDDLPPLEAYEELARANIELYMAGEGEVKKDEDWRERLQYKEDGTLVKGHLGNAMLFLENDPILSSLFCYDEFAHEKVVYRCPPWEKVEKFTPRAVNNQDKLWLAIELEKRGCKQAIPVVDQMLYAVVQKNTRNPAREYFGGLKWDGQPRLNNWLKVYCGANRDDADYLAAIGRKWMTAAVARVFKPATKFDHVLVLEGEQNIGKSSLLKELATIHGRAYFDDTIKITDMTNDKIVPKLQGILILELAEMAGFEKLDDVEAKRLITITEDRAVLKFQNEATIFPRQFVMAGTINPKGMGWLKDPTGDRRYWPAYITRIDMDALRRDKEQLWAEAVEAWRLGEKLYLEADMYERAQREQRKRFFEHPWMADIESLLDGKTRVTQDEIWDKLEIRDRTKRTRAYSNDIASIMMMLGWERKNLRYGEKVVWGWQKTSEQELEW